MTLKEMTDMKWGILILCIASCFGVEYSFDNPTVLKELLADHFSSKYNASQFEIYYSLFYSCLAIPNIVFPFLIGYLIDRLGVRKLYSLLAVLSVIGQSLVSVGVHNLSLATIYPGRMILGMACESMAIVQGIFLSQYFGKDQMSFVVGVIYSLANLGGVLNCYYAPAIAIKYGIATSFWVGTVFCAVVGSLAICGCILDRKNEKQLLAAQQQQRHQEDQFICVEERPLIQPKRIEAEEDVHEELAEVPSLLDIKQFPKTFWYICFGTFLIQASIQSFDVIGASYIEAKWFSMENLTAAAQDSGAVFSMFRLSSFIFSPLLGYMVDKTNERSLFFMVGCVMALASHILVIIIRPVVPCMLLGMASTLIYTACWPSIMQIVDKKNVGKACGLVTSLENVGLMIIPIFDGWLKNTFGSYDDSQMFLALLAFIGTGMGIVLYVKDTERGKWWASWKIDKTKST